MLDGHSLGTCHSLHSWALEEKHFVLGFSSFCFSEGDFWACVSF